MAIEGPADRRSRDRGRDHAPRAQRPSRNTLIGIRGLHRANDRHPNEHDREDPHLEPMALDPIEWAPLAWPLASKPHRKAKGYNAVRGLA